jgi:hypothetical protein
MDQTILVKTANAEFQRDAHGTRLQLETVSSLETTWNSRLMFAPSLPVVRYTTVRLGAKRPMGE